MSHVTDESMQDHFQGRSPLQDVTMRQQGPQETNGGFARSIVLKKSMIEARCWSARRERSTPYPSDGGRQRRHRDQLGHLAEVLGGGSEEELVFGTVWTSQAQAIELQDAFEVREQHLDLLSLPS